MEKCEVCGTARTKTGEIQEITLRNGATGEIIKKVGEVDVYNIEFSYKTPEGNICSNCVNIYKKVKNMLENKYGFMM